jgi:hypothetical protein
VTSAGIRTGVVRPARIGETGTAPRVLSLVAVVAADGAAILDAAIVARAAVRPFDTILP